MKSLVVLCIVVSAAWAGVDFSSRRPELDALPNYKCEPAFSERYCLNGGVCYVVIASDTAIYNCECRDGFVGQRCDYEDKNDSYKLASRQLIIETTTITYLTMVGTIVIIFIFIRMWVYVRAEPPVTVS